MKKATVTLEIVYDDTVYDHPEVWNYTGILDSETKILSSTPAIDVDLEKQLHKAFKDVIVKQHKKKPQ